MKGINKETFDMINSLTNVVNDQINELNQVINNLPQNERDKYVKHQADINNMIKIAKSGDLGELQKILNRYADSNNTK